MCRVVRVVFDTFRVPTGFTLPVQSEAVVFEELESPRRTPVTAGLGIVTLMLVVPAAILSPSELKQVPTGQH